MLHPVTHAQSIDREDLVAAARDSAETAVLLTIAYADLFDAAISEKEIHRYLIGQSLSQAQVAATLRSESVANRLDQGVVGYVLSDKDALLAETERRKLRADSLWPQARFYAKLIDQLPFVRMVAVTGSLAANNPTDSADIDLMIITAPGRLWLTRLLILAVVQLARRQQIELCPNYILTENALALRDQTIYAAHELSRLIPITGQAVYRRLMDANQWRYAFLPNAHAYQFPADRRQPKVKRLLETMLATAVGSRLEAWEQRRKIGRLSAMTPAGESTFEADVCKGHFHLHQTTTMAKMNAFLFGS